MDFPLNDGDIQGLSELHRRTHDKKIADKLKCIKLLSQNQGQSFIAELLEVDQKTVYN